MAKLKKIFLGLVWLLASIASLILIFLLVLSQSVSLQKWSAEKVSSRIKLSNNHAFSLSRIAPNLDFSFSFYDISLVQDDTVNILFSNELSIGVSAVVWRDNKFYLDELSVDSLKLYLNYDEAQEDWEILKLFNSNSKDTVSETSSFYVWTDAVELNYLDLTINKDSLPVNHIGLERFKINEFRISEDKIAGLLSFDKTIINGQNTFSKFNLALDKNGSVLGAKDFRLLSGESVIDVSNILFDYSDNKGFKCDVLINKFKFRKSDFSFLNDISGVPNNFELRAHISGSNEDLAIDDLRVTFGKNSFIDARANFNDISKNIDETFADIELFNSYLLPEDIMEVSSLINSEQNILNSFDYIKFEGNVTGFKSDFVAYGGVTTNLGALNSDLSFQLRGDLPKYSGSLDIDSLMIGPLLNQSVANDLSGQLLVEGEGLKPEDLALTATGNISQVTVRQNEFKDISIDGLLGNKSFSGKIAYRDSITTVALDLNAAYEQDELQYQLTYNVVDKDITRFMFDSAKGIAINCSGEIIGTGDEIENIEFFNRFDTLVFVKNDEVINLGNSDVRLARLEDQKQITVNSSILNGYAFGDLTKVALTDLVYQVLPNNPWFEVSKQNANNQIRLDLRLGDPKLFSWFTDSLVDWSNNTQLFGDLDPKSQSSQIVVNSDYIRVADVNLHELNVFLDKNNQEILSNIYLHKVEIGSFRLEEVALESKDEDDLIKWTFNNYNDFLNYTEAKGEVVFGDSTMLLGITEIKSKLSGQFINLENPFTITLNKDSIWAQSALLSMDAGQFYLEYLNADTRGLNEAVVYTDNLDLSFVNDFGLEELKLKGTATLDCHYQKETGIKLSLLANSVSIVERDFGNLEALFYQNLSSDTVDVFTRLYQSSTGEELNIAGSFNLSNQKVNGNVRFKDYEIAKLDHLFTEEVTQISGRLNGEVMLKGEVSEPKLKGELNLRNAHLFVDYLQTDFNIPNAKLKVRPDYLGLDYVKIYDARGKDANISVTAYHENFNNWNFDAFLEANDFLALNTQKYDNSLFYGRAAVSGTADVAGYDGRLNLELNLTPEKGTELTLPLFGAKEVYEQEFVEFVNPLETDTEKEKKSYTGINMDFTINANKNAEVIILFGDASDDVIKGRGNGTLNLNINEYDEFTCNGKYLIEDGEYTFTLQNIVNKKFDIVNGSTISWFGDPYDALLDVSAIYKRRVPLYDIVLIPDDRYRRRQWVNAVMNLNGALLSPDITFDIQLPNADDLTKGQVKSVLNSQQEVTRQVFSLLLFNRFSPPLNRARNNGDLNAGSVASNTGAELLSNQVSNWFSQFSSDMVVGINYRPGDILTSREVTLALSRQLFNERLTLSGNVGMTERNAYNPSGFLGDFSLEYSLTKDGRVRLKAFHETADNYYLSNNLSPFIQGLGLYYRKDFDSFQQLWRDLWRKKESKN